MRLKYDLHAGALYIRLTDEPVATTREIDDNTLVDLDASGGVIGIEVISIAHRWLLTEIMRDYNIPAAEAAQLHAYFLPVTPGATREAQALGIDRTVPVITVAA